MGVNFGYLLVGVESCFLGVWVFVWCCCVCWGLASIGFLISRCLCQNCLKDGWLVLFWSSPGDRSCSPVRSRRCKIDLDLRFMCSVAVKGCRQGSQD